MDTNVEKTTVFLPLSSGPTKFRSIVVKHSSQIIVSWELSQPLSRSPCRSYVKTSILVPSPEDVNASGNDTLGRRAVVSQTTNHKTFELFRILEFNRLVDRGVFTLVPLFNENDYRKYDARFDNSVKNEETSHAFPKSRFVVRAFDDKNHGLQNGAPTVWSSWQHLLLLLFGAHEDFAPVTRDISNAYRQAESTITSPVSSRPPPTLNLPI